MQDEEVTNINKKFEHMDPVLRKVAKDKILNIFYHIKEQDRVVYVGDEKYTIKQLIKEIEKETDIGREQIIMQYEAEYEDEHNKE